MVPRTSYKQCPWHWEERRLLPALDQLLALSYRPRHYAALLLWGSPLTQAQGFPICLLHIDCLMVSALYFWRVSPKFTLTKILVCLLCSQFTFLRHSFLDEEQNSFSKKISVYISIFFFSMFFVLFYYLLPKLYPQSQEFFIRLST